MRGGLGMYSGWLQILMDSGLDWDATGFGCDVVEAVSPDLGLYEVAVVACCGGGGRRLRGDRPEWDTSLPESERKLAESHLE